MEELEYGFKVREMVLDRRGIYEDVIHIYKRKSKGESTQYGGQETLEAKRGIPDPHRLSKKTVFSGMRDTCGLVSVLISNGDLVEARHEVERREDGRFNAS